MHCRYQNNLWNVKKCTLTGVCALNFYHCATEDKRLRVCMPALWMLMCSLIVSLIWHSNLQRIYIPSSREEAAQKNEERRAGNLFLLPPLFLYVCEEALQIGSALVDGRACVLLLHTKMALGVIMGRSGHGSRTNVEIWEEMREREKRSAQLA